ncbi:hypothetical protein TI03_03035 [Achromatium sp. WMS1]|nr:hypothetical protein TI03_03035 [Achromatium sp. WMS1]
MKLLQKIAVGVSIVGLSVGAANVAADGATLYNTRGCASCHGADGKTTIMPVYPILAGQNAAYCEKQIKDIKAGTRGNSPLMVGMVAGLSAAETKEICNYLESK